MLVRPGLQLQQIHMLRQHTLYLSGISYGYMLFAISAVNEFSKFDRTSFDVRFLHEGCYFGDSVVSSTAGF
jgi:hypothetical protein